MFLYYGVSSLHILIFVVESHNNVNIEKNIEFRNVLTELKHLLQLPHEHNIPLHFSPGA